MKVLTGAIKCWRRCEAAESSVEAVHALGNGTITLLNEERAILGDEVYLPRSASGLVSVSKNDIHHLSRKRNVHSCTTTTTSSQIYDG